MTATQVLASSGSKATGRLWWKHRDCAAAMLPRHAETGIRPILVLNDRTIAVAVHLPRSGESDADRATEEWMRGAVPLPGHLESLVRGDVMDDQPGVARTATREHVGGVVELVDAARATGRLALLALHPSDPDAMGLHITLFGVETVDADCLIREYGLLDKDLDEHRTYAEAENSSLFYLVGGTAEVFTQCSQNLFAKERVGDPCDEVDGNLADPPATLAQFLSAQFEALQVTVDADGLPGGSPRNGPIGGAAFVGTRRGKQYLLIPYHAGNAIHGHAAKLLTNQRSALVISDDHTYCRRMTITGRSWVWSHDAIKKRFPTATCTVAPPDDETGLPGSESASAPAVTEPAYWFVTRVDAMTWERERLPAYRLAAGREVCSINAGGEGRHTKKPKYFDAASIEPYDVTDQHRREALGRPTDASGMARAAWLDHVAPALTARENHLATTLST